MSDTAAPPWRFSPSPAGEALWENDLLVRTLYQYVQDEGHPRDMVTGMLLCKRSFDTIVPIWMRFCTEIRLSKILSACADDRVSVPNESVF